MSGLWICWLIGIFIFIIDFIIFFMDLSGIFQPRFAEEEEGFLTRIEKKIEVEEMTMEMKILFLYTVQCGQYYTIRWNSYQTF